MRTLLLVVLNQVIVALFLVSTMFPMHDAWAVQVTVKRVSDGDTIQVSNPDGGKNLKVRMVGMDTPELHLPAPGGVYSQGYWAEEAQRRLESLIPVGTQIELTILGQDKYGRSLGRIFLNGQDINLEMVRRGLAIPYMICEGKSCDSHFLKDNAVAEYLDACRQAEATGAGFFNPKQPLEELPFEFRLRIQKRQPDKFVGDFRTERYHAPKNYKQVDTCERIFFMTQKDAEGFGYAPAL